jgi:hypothetical protein
MRGKKWVVAHIVERRKKWKGMMIMKLTVIMERNPKSVQHLVEVCDKALGRESGWNHTIYILPL